MLIEIKSVDKVWIEGVLLQIFPSRCQKKKYIMIIIVIAINNKTELWFLFVHNQAKPVSNKISIMIITAVIITQNNNVNQLIQ